jgi:hypothetical protein
MNITLDNTHHNMKETFNPNFHRESYAIKEGKVAKISNEISGEKTDEKIKTLLEVRKLAREDLQTEHSSAEEEAHEDNKALDNIKTGGLNKSSHLTNEQETQGESNLIESSIMTKKLTSNSAPEQLEAKLTVENYSVFHPKDLNKEDRLYLYTESGNVYRVEHSKSHPGKLRFHNENTGNNPQYSVPAADSNPFFTVGEEACFVELNDPDDKTQGGRKNTTTPLERIEVVRNYNKAHADAENYLKSRHSQGEENFGSTIGQVLKQEVAGKIKHAGVGDYTVEESINKP